MFKRIAAFVACVALIASPPGETLVMAAHGETVFYVRPEGDRAAWEHAPRNRVYSDLQGAIDAAAKQTPAQVLVAVGVYNPTTAPNGGQTPHFSLKNGVTVTGGFKGDESGLVPAYGILEKDMADQSTQTVLKATVGFVFDHPSSAGIRRDAVLSNVTITGSETGGMRNADASPTIKNCIFTGNTGETGGGLQSLYGSPLVLSCYFVNNTAVLNGGGAAVTGGNPEFSNCTFAGNKAGESGGALYLENTDISIESTVFEGNANLSCDGGAIAAANDTALKLTNCHVNNNSSARHGGGVQISSGSAGFLNCLFEGNKGLYGGAIRADGALLSITNCTFSANSASQGGGVYMERPVAAILLGSEFHRNLADSGGGLYSFLSNVTLYNCKFTENAAKTGGGTENAGGSLSAANCVFAGNFGEQSGGGVKSGKTDASDSRLRLTNCTVSGNKSSVGAGVFSEDYAVFMANSLLAGNRKNTEADNFLSKAQLPADIKSTIIGEYFYETANVKTESGFDPERHFYEDCALVPHDGSRKTRPWTAAT